MVSNELIKFAGEGLDFYVGFAEYYNKTNKTAEDNDVINKAYFAEVERKSGIARGDMEMEAWVTNPQVQWAQFSVINAVVNTVLPQVLLPQFGMFADMRFLGIGDIFKFRIEPNQFYTVSKGN